jgi:hypothetical protein
VGILLPTSRIFVLAWAKLVGIYQKTKFLPRISYNPARFSNFASNFTPSKNHMILEDCILTKATNSYWEQRIAERFSILQDSDNIRYLSLKEYLIDTPQKFYNQRLYEDYYSFLISLSKETPNLLLDFFNVNAHKVNIAFDTLNDINNLRIHDKWINISEELEVIRFIENEIHYNYLQLIESTFFIFITPIAKQKRLQREKSTDGLDVYNCVEELQSSHFEYLRDYYNNTIRNGIAHGDFIYTSAGITYKGKKGEPYLTDKEEVIHLFDNLIDYCNAISLAIKCFMIINQDCCHKHGLRQPKSNLIHELKAQANTPQWQIIDCLEYSIMDNQKQLNIFASNNLFDLTSVNHFALRSAIMAEYFAPNYDRYFITFQSKYSDLTGWGAYKGDILRKGRIEDKLESYKGVIDGDLLFFIPKYRLPKFLIKVSMIRLLIKENLKLWRFSKEKDYSIRDTNIHKKPQGYLCLSEARVYLNSSDKNEIERIVYTEYRNIVQDVIKYSKKRYGKFNLNRFLPVKFVCISIYDSDMRLHQFHKVGLKSALICTLSINTTKYIKNRDILAGTPEQIGKYRIVWNKKWLSTKNQGAI